MRNHNIAKEKGAKVVRHYPLMIRLECVVRESMGYKGGLYNIVAKVCGLPSDRQIRRGHNHDIHSSLMERTTSLHRDRTGYHSRESRDKSKKIKQRDAIIEKLLKTTAIDMPMNENLDSKLLPRSGLQGWAL